MCCATRGAGTVIPTLDPDRGSGHGDGIDGRTGHSGRVLFLAIVAAIGGFLFGFDTAVINGAVDAIEQTFGTSSFVTGFVVAVALLGSAVGAWFAGAVADRYGRIRVMLLSALLFATFSDRVGIGVLAMGPRHLAFHWRCRDRGSVRHCPGLYR